MMKQKHFKWLAVLGCLLTGMALQAQETDDLQAYLDRLAQEQTAKSAIRKSPTVDIPIGLPEVDLSKFSSNQNRTTTLSVSISVKFVGGSISAASSFAGGGCLLEVKGGATVVLDATANVDARLATAGNGSKAAVGVYAGSTLYQYGTVMAPGNGTGVAIYLDDATSAYYYTVDKTTGHVDNAAGGTFAEIGTIPDTPVVIDGDWTVGPGGDFPDINSAMDDDRVKDGDVMVVQETTSITEEQIITKSITLAGYGYKPLSASVRRVNFVSVSVEAPGVTLRGLSLGSVTLCDDDAVIERCLVSTLFESDSYVADNATVRGCFITKGFSVEASEGWDIYNNIIISESPIVITAATVNHNLIVGKTASLTVEDVVMTNNIYHYYFTSTDGWDTGDNFYFSGDNTITHNLFDCEEETQDEYPDNLFCKGYEQFVRTGAIYEEGYWTLAANSAAIGYATDGTDCGPWAGDFPYWIDGVEPTEQGGDVTLEGDVTLDMNQADNPSRKIFQSLLSLFTAMADGIDGDMNVKVANSIYYYTVDDTTYPVLQAMVAQLSATQCTVAMTSTAGATFNFQVDNTFLISHVNEAAYLYGMIQAVMRYITLTNITLMLNGNAIVNEDFQVEPNDLLALRNMYQNWDGEHWTSKQWSFMTNGRRRADFPGVTFNDDGRVTAIDLENNGLKGDVFRVSSPQLEKVTSLNLCRNQLTGDVALLTAPMTQLRTLDLSYNLLNQVSEPSAIASTCSTKNLKYQYREWKEGQAYDLPYAEAIWSALPAVIPVCKQEMTLSLPSLFAYEYVKEFYLHDANDPTLTYGSLYHPDSPGKYTLYRYSNYNIWKLPQDFLAVVEIPFGFNASNSAYLVKFHYAEGDADLSAYTNIYDVQYTLNYILSPQSITDFNFSAANTYEDQIVNVQDIVATVNIILAQNMDETATSRYRSDANVSFDGSVYAQQGSIMMQASKAVSAIDIALEGVSTSEVSLMLNQRDFQMIGRNTDTGSRYVIFSPAGKSIPTGKAIALLRMSRAGEPEAIQCSDPDAQEVRIDLTGASTGIGDVTYQNHKEDNNNVYDLQGRLMNHSSLSTERETMLRKGIYINSGKKIVVR